mmetsp:Transcript_12197/g.36600  ORF Transcript_12197/g.36600 Transcript_12197/m.36600 type:complete len:230 (+) Transcript_12197:2244-2933(+)
MWQPCDDLAGSQLSCELARSLGPGPAVAGGGAVEHRPQCLAHHCQVRLALGGGVHQAAQQGDPRFLGVALRRLRSRLRRRPRSRPIRVQHRLQLVQPPVASSRRIVQKPSLELASLLRGAAPQRQQRHRRGVVCIERQYRDTRVGGHGQQVRQCGVAGGGVHLGHLLVAGGDEVLHGQQLRHGARAWVQTPQRRPLLAGEQEAGLFAEGCRAVAAEHKGIHVALRQGAN